jgi:hypothetical protein
MIILTMMGKMAASWRKPDQVENEHRDLTFTVSMATEY